MGLMDEDPVTELSDLHRKLTRKLEKMGLRIMEEIRFPPYTVDIYLPDFHIAIEVDGPHHEIKRDLKRDDHLLEVYNLYIIRFNGKEKVSLVRKIVEENIEQYGDSALARFDEIKDRVPWL
jgi:very-short-patch-repair endonuclease